MSRTATPSTRERLVQAAHTLCYRDGFHTVGLEAIIDAVGVTKTTFYNHFESKDDLVLEVLRWHDEWWRNQFLDTLRKFGGDSPRGQLLAAADAVDFAVHSDNFNGCIFINVAAQFPLPHDPAHQAAVQHKRKMQDLLQQIAGYAGADDPAALACEITMILEGAYISAHMLGGSNVTDTARRLIAAAVDVRVPKK